MWKLTVNLGYGEKFYTDVRPVLYPVYKGVWIKSLVSLPIIIDVVSLMVRAKSGVYHFNWWSFGSCFTVCWWSVQLDSDLLQMLELCKCSVFLALICKTHRSIDGHNLYNLFILPIDYSEKLTTKKGQTIDHMAMFAVIIIFFNKIFTCINIGLLKWSISWCSLTDP